MNKIIVSIVSATICGIALLEASEKKGDLFLVAQTGQSMRIPQRVIPLLPYISVKSHHAAGEQPLQSFAIDVPIDTVRDIIFALSRMVLLLPRADGCYVNYQVQELVDKIIQSSSFDCQAYFVKAALFLRQGQLANAAVAYMIHKSGLYEYPYSQYVAELKRLFGNDTDPQVKFLINKHALLRHIGVSECSIADLITENQIPAVDSKGCLNLSCKGITSLYGIDQIADKDHIRELRLINNKIQAIPGRIFHTFAQLKTLYLNNNFIQRVENDSFIGLEQLERLFLSRNHIKTLEPQSLIPLRSLKQCVLEDNPIELFRSMFHPEAPLEAVLPALEEEVRIEELTCTSSDGHDLQSQSASTKIITLTKKQEGRLLKNLYRRIKQ